MQRLGIGVPFSTASYEKIIHSPPFLSDDAVCAKQFYVGKIH